MKFVRINNVNAAIEYAKTNSPVAAVEAEYGDLALEESHEGVEFALNHHGLRSHNPAPSVRMDIANQFHGTFVGSHFDLDTLMGVMWLNGDLDSNNPSHAKFGEIAAFNDLNGPHKSKDHPSFQNEEGKWLRAFWHWSQNNRAPFSKETIVDMTEYVQSAIVALQAILNNDYDFEASESSYIEFENAIAETLDVELSIPNRIHVFVGEVFACSGYNQTIDGEKSVTEAIVWLNTKSGAITCSAEDNDAALRQYGEGGVAKFLKDIFGPEAGGHLSIGGTPRDQEYTIDDLKMVISKILG